MNFGRGTRQALCNLPGPEMVASSGPADIMNESTSPHPGGPHVGLRQGQREPSAPYNGENLGPCQQIPYLQPSQLYHNHDGRGRLLFTRPPMAILGPSTRNPQEDRGFILLVVLIQFIKSQAYSKHTK